MPDEPTHTPAGSVRFEQARRRLAEELGIEAELVTDAQVAAYLAPGPAPAPERKKDP